MVISQRWSAIGVSVLIGLSNGGDAGFRGGVGGRTQKAKTAFRQGILVPDFSVNGNLTVARGSPLGPKRFVERS